MADSRQGTYSSVGGSAAPSSDSGFNSGESVSSAASSVSSAASNVTVTAMDTDSDGARSDSTTTNHNTQSHMDARGQQQTVLHQNAVNRGRDCPGLETLSMDSGVRSISSAEVSKSRGPDLPGQEEQETRISRTSQWVDESYQVFLRNIDGKSHTINVKATDTVETFQEQVHSKLGQEVSQLRFTTAEGKTLERGRGLTMAQLNIKKESTIFAQGRLRGGHISVDFNSS